MGFSCMNGRLRQVTQTITTAPSTNTNQYQNKTNADNAPIVSLLPFTLPNGIIATTEISPSLNEKENSTNGRGDDENEQQRCSSRCTTETTLFMLRELKEIHRVRGRVITDHCWAIVQTKHRDAADSDADIHGDDSFDKKNHMLVLAILTRAGGGDIHRMNIFGDDDEQTNDKHENQNDIQLDKDGLAVCSIYIYSRPMYDSDNINQNVMNSTYQDYSIDCGNENDGVPKEEIGEGQEKELHLFTHSYQINLSHFVNCITMDDHILVIGSYIGAKIYNIHDILSNSTPINTTIHKRQDTNNTKELDSIRIMKPCIVQAMCLSYPYFAAASGDRIGIWRIDYFMDYFHHDEQNQHQYQQSCNDNSNKTEITTSSPSSLSKNRKHLVAIWNTKVDNCHSRITCVEMIQCQDAGNILALSCWDGSAFVFRHSIKNKMKNSKENEKEEWKRVIPSQKQQNGNHNNNKDGNIDNRDHFVFTPPVQLSWEDPSSIDSDIMFPTFLTLFPLPERNSNLKKRKFIMAVTCPGRSIIQCYDIDKREWYKDIEPSDSSSLVKDDTCQGMFFELLTCSKQCSVSSQFLLNLLFSIHFLC